MRFLGRIRCVLRRPYGTGAFVCGPAFPGLKRGANNRRAYGAIGGTLPIRPSIEPNGLEDSCGRVESESFQSMILRRFMLNRSFSKWVRATEAAVLAVAICFSVGAGNPSGRLNDLDHRLMCTCGCAQILGECNHVGCTQSAQELSELRTDIAAGMTDEQILSAFVGKYGATVLAAPPTHGFDLVAWIAPFAVFGAALAGTILLIRRWGGLGGKPQPAAATDGAVPDAEERERLKRIRRETDSDGGY